MHMQIRTAKDFGAALKQARMRRGLTQVQLAKMLRVDQARISEIERGSTGTSVGAILRILGVLHASIDIRLDGEGSSQRSRAPRAQDIDLDAIANTGLDTWPTKR
jgi:transcriptional regulator with XRE-family HTH domain